MTKNELYSKLEQAQRLLADVYDFAQEQNPELASLMSCADTCIIEAIETDWKTNEVR
jgi:hypothetical protein